MAANVPGAIGPHVHKTTFQLVYVLKGWIEFEYEGQGRVPDLAALTEGLILGASRVTAIELRPRPHRPLREQFTPEQWRCTRPMRSISTSRRRPRPAIVGNLPYNISSPLLFRIASVADVVRDVHVILQKEVVAHTTTQLGTADYGRLTVMLQATFRVERLFVVPAGAFRPVPKVESAVARLVPLREQPPRSRMRRLSRA